MYYTRCASTAEISPAVNSRDGWSRDIAFGLVTSVRVGEPRIHGSIPSSRERAFSVLHNTHAGGARRLLFCGGGVGDKEAGG